MGQRAAGSAKDRAAVASLIARSALALLALAASSLATLAGAQKAPTSKPATMKLESPAFAAQGEIPRKHTCEGDDSPPAYSWSEPPPGTKSFVLILDDPDAPDPAAPKRTWVHWVLFNIPKDARGLPAGGKPLPGGTSEGVNDWKKTGYGGPCPPIGRHRYVHKLYALDTELALMKPTKAEIETAMNGHVLAKAELIGTYQKSGK